MNPPTSHNSRTVWPYFFAVAAHCAVGFLLLLARMPAAASASNVQISEADKLVFFRLVPPPEGDSPIFMASSNPEILPPEGQDSAPDAAMITGGQLNMPAKLTGGPVSDAEIADMMARDREKLRAELNQLTETAMANPLPSKPIPTPPPDSGDKGGSDKGPEGAIRELDLEGFPQSVVDDIMKRYKLRIVTRKIEGGRRGQSFLSSASKGDSERYFGGMTVPAGVYEVFQLSRESVALMSRLEEQALRDKGFEPLKSRIVRIVFGIVRQPGGEYVLGVKSLEAEAVAP